MTYDKAPMDVVDDVQACLAPLPALFSYIVITSNVDIRMRISSLSWNNNLERTFYHNWLVIKDGKAKGLVGDGGKYANFSKG